MKLITVKHLDGSITTKPLWFFIPIVIFCFCGCKQPNDRKWQFAPDMADSPVFKSQSSLILPPDNSVAVDAIIYPDDQFEAEKLISSPFSTTNKDKLDYFTSQGKHLYNTFCQHCHGAKAQGNGTIIDLYPKPPDLTSDLYLSRKDGFFFHIITFGGAMMPALGGSIDDLERFKIILYLRQLQNSTIDSDDSASSEGTHQITPKKNQKNNQHLD